MKIPTVGDEVAAQPDERAGDDRSDGGREAVEELAEIVGQVRLDVEDRERQHEDEAGQHEAEACQQPAEPAGPVPAEVDAELVRLRAREDLVDGERLLEGLVGDPAELVDALALDHRDLRRRPAPGERAEPQEAKEDRGRRVRSFGRRAHKGDETIGNRSAPPAPSRHRGTSPGWGRPSGGRREE